MKAYVPHDLGQWKGRIVRFSLHARGDGALGRLPPASALTERKSCEMSKLPHEASVKPKVWEMAGAMVFDWYFIKTTSTLNRGYGGVEMTVERPEEKAERQLVALIRLQESEDFDLSVMFSNGIWTIRVEDRETFTKALGRGGSFAEAWHRQDLPWD